MSEQGRLSRVTDGVYRASSSSCPCPQPRIQGAFLGIPGGLAAMAPRRVRDDAGCFLEKEGPRQGLCKGAREYVSRSL